MTPESIREALETIAGATDPTVKHLQMASLVSAVFAQKEVKLVVVGGSAIEFYTEGAYVSGDLDLCLVSPARLDLRTRQECMGILGGTGGPRSWKVAGMYVDLLGEVETLARTAFTELDGPYGVVRLLAPEDVLVERVLVAHYPHPNTEADNCARKLVAVALLGRVEMDWGEVGRLADLPAYGIRPELIQLVGKVADELGRPNPCHP